MSVNFLAFETPVRPTSTSSQRIRPKSAGPDESIRLQLGESTQLNTAISALINSSSLHDQVDLLYYIHSCSNLNYEISIEGELVTVRDLLEEVYQKAAQAKYWSIVRQAAGLLRKVVNSLTISVTDLLIRQKQITSGYGEQGIKSVVLRFNDN